MKDQDIPMAFEYVLCNTINLSVIACNDVTNHHVLLSPKFESIHDIFDEGTFRVLGNTLEL